MSAPCFGTTYSIVDSGLRLLGAVAGLQDVAVVAHRQADIAVGERVDVFRRIELLDVGPDRFQEVAGLLDIGRVLRIRLETEIDERRLGDVLGVVEDIDAAILELRHDLRLEKHVPRIDRRVGHDRLDLVDVVAEAVGAPHVDHGVFVARIVARHAIGDRLPHVDEVRELGLVELEERPGLDLAGDVRIGRNDDVVAGAAGEELGLDDVVVVVDIVNDLDSGLLGEILENGRVDIVRPIVNVDHFVLGPGGSGKTEHQSQRQKAAHPTSNHRAHLFSLSRTRGPRRHFKVKIKAGDSQRLRAVIPDKVWRQESHIGMIKT